MYLVEIGVRDFLVRTLEAARDCDYAGLVVVAARAADAGAPLRQVASDWESLHSVTGRHIAVAFPDPRAHAGEPASHVRLPRDGTAVGVDGLAVVRAEHRRWADAFATAPDRLAVDGRTAARRPAVADDVQAAGTAVVDELRDLFDLSEDEIPCLLLFSLWEGTALLPIADGFDMYAYLKGLAAATEGPLRAVREAHDAYTAARAAGQRCAAAAAEAERAAAREARTAKDWQQRVDGLRSYSDRVLAHAPLSASALDPLRSPAADPQAARHALSLLEAAVLAAPPGGERDRLLRKTSGAEQQLAAETAAAAARALRADELRSAALAAAQAADQTDRLKDALAAARAGVGLALHAEELARDSGLRRVPDRPRQKGPYRLDIAQPDGGGPSGIRVVRT